MKNIFCSAFALSILLTACQNGNNTQVVTPNNNSNSSWINFQVVNKTPHDVTYFTEGFEFYDGVLLESSGGDNNNSPYPSAMGIVDMATGKVKEKIALDKSKYFGEGITVFNDKLYFVTWRSRQGFVYDAKTFKQLDQFSLPSTEGWGLTHDSSSIIMSDGTSAIYFMDPTTYQTKYTLNVYDHNGPVGNINELEYVDGFIYANQWQTNYILKIDAQEGKVVGRIDLTALSKEIQSIRPEALEMNGIAYHPTKQSFFITGKLWPFIYEIKLN